MKAEDILPDRQDRIRLGGVEIRKGSVGAFIANARLLLEEELPTAQRLQAQRLIGYLPEGSPCYAEMTVQGFLDFIAEIRGYRGAGKRERVARALGLLELFELRDARLRTLVADWENAAGRS